MTDNTDTEATALAQEDTTATDAEPAVEETAEPFVEETDPDTFPREVVERLRQENGKYRQRAQQADSFAHRLHTELVRSTGRLADPTDLAFDERHLDDPETLMAAIDELVAAKPHLASRRPSGDIGQGHRGPAAEGFSLLGLLKQRT